MSNNICTNCAYFKVRRIGFYCDFGFISDQDLIFERALPCKEFINKTLLTCSNFHAVNDSNDKTKNIDALYIETYDTKDIY